MKTVVKSAALLAAALIGTAAVAETPNRVTQTFEEFVKASGCEIRPNASGQMNIYAATGGNCPVDVATAYHGVGFIGGINPGPDGTLGTADDYSVAISDN